MSRNMTVSSCVWLSEIFFLQAFFNGSLFLIGVTVFFVKDGCGTCCVLCIISVDSICSSPLSRVVDTSEVME